MKEILTSSYIKLAGKYPKSETEPYNPWAVCNKSTGGKKKDPAAFERCVHHIKDQNKEKNKKSSEEEQIVEAADKGWPKKLKKGRFTEWCKRNGFSGPSRSCADKAMNSDDSSVRGMASFYLNTTLKKKK